MTESFRDEIHDRVDAVPVRLVVVDVVVVVVDVTLFEETGAAPAIDETKPSKSKPASGPD